MLQPGFEWFVAWRHLRDPERRSRRTLVVGLAALAAGGLCFLAAALVPRFMHVHARAPGEWMEVQPLLIVERLRTTGMVAVGVGLLLTPAGGAVRRLHRLHGRLDLRGLPGHRRADHRAVGDVGVRGRPEGEDPRHQGRRGDRDRPTSGPSPTGRRSTGKVAGIPDVVGSMPYIETEVIIKHATNPAGMGIILRGIDPARAPCVLGLEHTMQEGKIAYLQHPEQIPTDDGDFLRDERGGRRQQQPAPAASAREAARAEAWRRSRASKAAGNPAPRRPCRRGRSSRASSSATSCISTRCGSSSAATSTSPARCAASVRWGRCPS